MAARTLHDLIRQRYALDAGLDATAPGPPPPDSPPVTGEPAVFPDGEGRCGTASLASVELPGDGVPGAGESMAGAIPGPPRAPVSRSTRGPGEAAVSREPLRERGPDGERSGAVAPPPRVAAGHPTPPGPARPVRGDDSSAGAVASWGSVRTPLPVREESAGVLSGSGPAIEPFPHPGLERPAGREPLAVEASRLRQADPAPERSPSSRISRGPRAGWASNLAPPDDRPPGDDPGPGTTARPAAEGGAHRRVHETWKSRGF